MITSGIILFLLCVVYIFIVYQALVHKRLYYICPTFVGFKNRKKDISSRFEAIIFSIILIPLGLFFCYLLMRYVMHFFLVITCRSIK